jgi:predicted RNA methylase
MHATVRSEVRLARAVGATPASCFDFLKSFSLSSVLAAALFTIFGVFSTDAQVPPTAPQHEQLGSELERVVPFVPTPMEVVEKMLELAHVGNDDVVYDLGSGDGRIVIMAAQKFGAQAVGVELDPKLFEQSSARIKELGLEQQAKILHENMYQVDFHRRHALSADFR